MNHVSQFRAKELRLQIRYDVLLKFLKMSSHAYDGKPIKILIYSICTGVHSNFNAFILLVPIVYHHVLVYTLTLMCSYYCYLSFIKWHSSLLSVNPCNFEKLNLVGALYSWCYTFLSLWHLREWLLILTEIYRFLSLVYFIYLGGSV